MQNASALHTDAWVKLKDKEAQTDFKKWDSAKKKKWQADYMDHCDKTAAMILANAQETLAKAEALKNSMKTALDGVEKIVKEKREKKTPLSDAERDWVAKSKKVIEESPTAFSALTAAFSANSPMAYRDGFMDIPQKEGALTPDMVAKIKAGRLAGINVGNEFGKQSPVVARLAEYRERWSVLFAELARAEQSRSGNPQDAAAQLTKQIKDLQDGNQKWEFDFTNDIGKLVTNIESHFDGKVDKANDKSFGASLLKNVKLLVDAKAKAKEKKAIADKQLQIKVKLDKWTTDIKGIKGALKTRLMAQESLTASLKDAGPYADPFRKILADIGIALKKRESEVDALVVQVNQAIAELKK